MVHLAADFGSDQQVAQQSTNVLNTTELVASKALNWADPCFFKKTGQKP
jgi:hypothetical protein